MTGEEVVCDRSATFFSSRSKLTRRSFSARVRTWEVFLGKLRDRNSIPTKVSYLPKKTSIVQESGSFAIDLRLFYCASS